MLHDDQVTSAPRAIKVNTAVWIVMCKHPAIRAPLRVVRLYIQHEAPLNLAFQLLLVQFLFFPKPLESFTLKAT
jgi:hypothetical protein